MIDHESDIQGAIPGQVGFNAKTHLATIRKLAAEVFWYKVGDDDVDRLRQGNLNATGNGLRPPDQLGATVGAVELQRTGCGCPAGSRSRNR